MLQQNCVVNYKHQTNKLSDSLSIMEKFLMLKLDKQLENALMRAILMYFYRKDLLTKRELIIIQKDLGLSDNQLDIITHKSDVYV